MQRRDVRITEAAQKEVDACRQYWDSLGALSAEANAIRSRNKSRVQLLRGASRAHSVPTGTQVSPISRHQELVKDSLAGRLEFLCHQVVHLLGPGRQCRTPVTPHNSARGAPGDANQGTTPSSALRATRSGLTPTSRLTTKPRTNPSRSRSAFSPMQNTYEQYIQTFTNSGPTKGSLRASLPNKGLQMPGGIPAPVAKDGKLMAGRSSGTCVALPALKKGVAWAQPTPEDGPDLDERVEEAQQTSLQRYHDQVASRCAALAESGGLSLGDITEMTSRQLVLSLVGRDKDKDQEEEARASRDSKGALTKDTAQTSSGLGAKLDLHTTILNTRSLSDLIRAANEHTRLQQEDLKVVSSALAGTPTDVMARTLQAGREALKSTRSLKYARNPLQSSQEDSEHDLEDEQACGHHQGAVQGQPGVPEVSMPQQRAASKGATTAMRSPKWDDPLMMEACQLLSPSAAEMQQHPPPPFPAFVDVTHDAAAVLQARLERVWEVLDIPLAHRMDMVIRYTARDKSARFDQLLQRLEEGAVAIMYREELLTFLLDVRDNLLSGTADDITFKEVYQLAAEFIRMSCHVEASANMLEEEFGEKLMLGGQPYPESSSPSIPDLEELLRLAYVQLGPDHSSLGNTD